MWWPSPKALKHTRSLWGCFINAWLELQVSVGTACLWGLVILCCKQMSEQGKQIHGDSGWLWLETGGWQKQELMANGPGHLCFIWHECISMSGAPLHLRKMHIL